MLAGYSGGDIIALIAENYKRSIDDIIEERGVLAQCRRRHPAPEAAEIQLLPHPRRGKSPGNRPRHAECGDPARAGGPLREHLQEPGGGSGADSRVQGAAGEDVLGGQQAH